VYLAPSVQERARTIVDGCPENTIAAAIVQGQVRFASGRALIDGAGWEATAVRRPGVLRPAPRAWHVTAITRTSQREE
jgi:hypothetical protein